MSDTENIQPSEEQSSTGLLDSATATEENQANDGAPQESSISHIENESPAQRPDFWPENFWKKDANEPDLEGIAKSWYDLRKVISKGDHKAPESYDTKSFGDDAADNPLVSTKAEAIINGMANWGRGLVSKGILSADEFDEFKIMGGTAKGLQVMMKIRSSYEGRVPTESIPQQGMPSDEELQQMVGDSKYDTDPSYRTKVEKLFNQRYNQ